MLSLDLRWMVPPTRKTIVRGPSAATASRRDRGRSRSSSSPQSRVRHATDRQAPVSFGAGKREMAHAEGPNVTFRHILGRIDFIDPPEIGVKGIQAGGLKFCIGKITFELARCGCCICDGVFCSCRNRADATRQTSPASSSAPDSPAHAHPRSPAPVFVACCAGSAMSIARR